MWWAGSEKSLDRQLTWRIDALDALDAVDALVIFVIFVIFGLWSRHHLAWVRALSPNQAGTRVLPALSRIVIVRSARNPSSERTDFASTLTSA